VLAQVTDLCSVDLDGGEERHRERWKDCRLFERWSRKDKMEQDRSWVAWDWEGMPCSCYTTAPVDACEISGSIRGESPAREDLERF
jgi:hypothetical protein